MSKSGKKATAPVPSPRHISQCRQASLPRASKSRWPAGSFDTWLAIIYCFAVGQIPAATRAPVAEMTPSMTTGILRAAPPKNRPTITAISNPPTLATTSMASFLSGLFTSTAFLMALILRFKPSLERPAPRPVIFSTGISRSTDATALLVVVFPIPISPVAMMPYPFSFSISTISMPVSMALTACSLVMAGSFVMFFVP